MTMEAGSTAFIVLAAVLALRVSVVSAVRRGSFILGRLYLGG